MIQEPSRSTLLSKSSRAIAVGVLASVLVCFAGLGTRRLWTPDEPLGAAIGRSMLVAHFATYPNVGVIVRFDEVEKLPAAIRSHLRFLYDERGRKATPYGIATWSNSAPM